LDRWRRQEQPQHTWRPQQRSDSFRIHSFLSSRRPARPKPNSEPTQRISSFRNSATRREEIEHPNGMKRGINGMKWIVKNRNPLYTRACLKESKSANG
jgi:hypothetical protein